MGIVGMTKEQFKKELEAIQAEARKRHEFSRKAAKARGRRDFPALPFECSWAFEEQLRKRLGAPL